MIIKEMIMKMMVNRYIEDDGAHDDDDDDMTDNDPDGRW